MNKGISVRALCGWAIAVLLVVAMFSRGNPDRIRLQGYYQSPAMDRIMTYRLPRAGMALAELPHAIQHTPGQMTAEYFYEPEVPMPIDGVTRARDLAAANRVIFETSGLAGPRFARMVARGDGGRRIEVDCRASPGDALCGGAD